MLKDQCISVTELKKNANVYLKSLDKEKIIFVNNKPIAVLMNIDDYEKSLKDHDLFDVTFAPYVSPKEILDTYDKKYGG